MSAHRRVRTHGTKLRRSFTAAVVAVASGSAFLVGATPAHAASTWYVATTGTNNVTCGASAATPCQTVTFLIAQARFVDGDTINVAAGSYTDKPAFGAKTATVQGAGAASTSFTGGGTAWALTSNVTAAKTLRLNDLTLTNGKGTNGLGGAFAAGSGQVVMTNVNLTGSTSTNVGGGAYVPAAASGSLAMNGGTVSGNTATNGGGGIYTAGGTVTLNGTTISGNTVTGIGGGGFYAAAGTHTLTGVTLSGNKAPAGVGGAVASAAALTFSGGTITGNTAVNGAGIYNNTGTTTVNGTSLSSNTATNQGAALFQQAGTTNLNTASVTGNTATALAAVAIIGGTLNTSGGMISGNTALNGGGLYNGGVAVVDGTTFDNNTANGGTTANGGNAGAIYNAGALTVKNASLTGNKVVANTNAAPGITGFGGAIFGGTLAANAPTIDVTNTRINGGSVSGGNAVTGGAVAIYQSTVSGGTTTKLTANGLTLSKNVANAAGGLFSYGNVTLTNSVLDQNAANNPSTGYGGGLYLAVYPGVTTAPVAILDNTAVTGNSATVGGGGGIVGGYALTVRNGSSVNGNSAPTGAGLYSAATLTVSDSHLDGNTASNSGGGLYTLAATALTNTTLNGNTAAFLGGGLVAAAPLTVTDGQIDSNTGYGAGGVLVGDSIVASFKGTKLTNNTSTGANFGGGAILSGGQLSLKNTTLTGNTADGSSGSGGAIFSGSGNDNVTTSLRIDNSLVANNDAFAGSAVITGSNGTNDTNKTAIASSTITGNESSGTVGALELLAPTSITASTITDNTATGTNNVGALYAAAGTASVSGSVIAGNSGFQCAAAPTDGGYNLNNPNDTKCGFSAAKNDLFSAPQLGALANNGGPTQSRLPGPASPALDKIPAGTATGTTDAVAGTAILLCGGASDQRGTARPQGAKCDIGAVEAEQISPTVDGPSAFTYTVGIAGAAQAYTSTGSPQATLSASGLPTGVTFSDNGDGTGKITGTPASGTGGVYTVTVKATNEAGTGTKTVTLTVNQAPALAGPAAATYTVGQAGGPTTFTSSGYPTSVLTSLGILPSGVGFTDHNDGTGSYAGTPATGTGGTYPLTVRASNGTAPDASKPFTLTVNEAPALSGPAAATFKVGTASSSAPDFVANGFPVPALSATGLPTGLSLLSTGPGAAKISGSAANGTGGLYPNVEVKAENGVGTAATRSVALTVNEAPELVGPTLARFVTGSASSIGFSSDGYPVAAVTESGALPSGLTFHDNGNGSATISGTAATGAVGTYPITITASNGQSPDAVTHLTLEVVPPLSVSTTTLPNAAYQSAYSAQLGAVGGQPGYSWQVTLGQLPPGLAMNQFGLITGSPTVSSGIYFLTVKATDSANPAQTATRMLKIQVGKGDTQVVAQGILLDTTNGDVKVTVGQVEADLKGGFPLQPIASATVSFKSGTASVCSGKTDVKGHVKCAQNVLNAILTPLKGSVTATFAGDTHWNGSSGTAPLVKTGP